MSWKGERALCDSFHLSKQAWLHLKTFKNCKHDIHNLSLKRVLGQHYSARCMCRQYPGGSRWVHLACHFRLNDKIICLRCRSQCLFLFWRRANAFLVYHIDSLHSELIISSHLSTLIDIRIHFYTLSFIPRFIPLFC